MSGKLGWWRRLRGSADIAGCLEVTKNLQSYLDGQLDAVTATRLARHLEICRRCGLEATTYQEVKRALARRDKPPPPDILRRLQAFAEQLATDGPTDTTG